MSTFSLSNAKALVLTKINADHQHSPDKPEMVIIDEATIHRAWGWVFFYDSCDDTLIAGNAPIIVNRHTGELVVTGTACPVEDYVRDYEAGLSEDFQHSVTPDD